MMRKIKKFFRGIKPIALSHHPICEYFDDGSHTIKIFGKEWCIGCFVTYPTAFIVYLVLSLFNIFSRYDPLILAYIGFGSCSIYLLSILGLTKWKPMKILTKIIIGWGIAFCVAAIWSLPLYFWPQFLLTFLFFNIGHTFINIMRGYSIYKICHKCEFVGDWHVCPGMGPILHPEERKDENISR